MRLLHCSDTHVDSARRLSDTRAILERIVREAAEHQVDLICHTGDWYDADSNEAERSLVAEFVQAAAEVAPLVGIRGNHEVSLDAATLMRLRTKHPVRIYERPNIGEVDLGLVSTAGGLVGPIAIPWFTKSHLAAGAAATMSGEDLTLAVNELAGRLLIGATADADRIRAAGAVPIGLHHGTVHGAKFSSGFVPRGISVEFNEHQLAEVGCEYFALGHYHVPQEWQGGRIAYAGSTERMDFGEPEAKGYRLIEIDGGEFVSNTFVELPARRIELLECDLTEDLDHLKSHYLQLIERRFVAIGQGALVRFRYRIRPEDLHLVDEDAIRTALYDAGAFSVKVEPDIVHEARVRTAEITSAPDTWSKVEMWAESKGIEMTPEERERRKLALDSLETPKAEEVTA